MFLSFYFTAPNEYKIPSVFGSSKEGPIRSAPAFTITGRHKTSISPTAGVPGPGAYDAEYTITMKRSPMYSIGSRHKIPTDDTLKPGPGAHYPEIVNLGHGPAYSFGIKHSQYLGSFHELPSQWRLENQKYMNRLPF